MKLTKTKASWILVTVVWYVGWILYSNIAIGRSWNDEEVFVVTIATILPVVLWGIAWIRTLPDGATE